MSTGTLTVQQAQTLTSLPQRYKVGHIIYMRAESLKKQRETVI